jgi:competence protein ComEA
VVRAPLPGGWLPPPESLEQPPDPPEEVEALVETERSWAKPAELLEGFVPEPLRGGRWDPGRRGLVALGTVAAAAAVVAGFVMLRGRPHEIAPPPVIGGPVASAPSGAEVVVDVDGKVRRPGIVRLPAGSRVDDAVRAAGGPLPGASLAGLNLARKLADGEQVLVGVAPAAGAAGAAPDGDARVDVNAADVTTLDGLPGIGPVLAQHIVDWRTEHGRFASIDQLREVPGIGESKYAALKNKVRT